MLSKIKTIERVLNAHPLLFIYIVFFLVQIFLFLKIGVVTNLEAEKYITEGNLLYDTGRFSASKYIFYLPVILLVYLCRLIGVSYFLIPLIQVALSGLSLFYFYKLGKNIGNKTIAFYSSLFLALFVPLQLWNFHLYSDSIFISLTIIFSYMVFKFGNQEIKGTFIIIGFLALLIFSRPHGLLFIPPTIIFFLFRKQTRKELFSSIVFCLMLLISMYFFLNAAFNGGGDMDAMKPFIEEHIICFVPMLPEGADLNFVKTANPVYDIFYYIFHNPFHFLKLMGLKLMSFFNLTRSYYSEIHNIFLVIFLIPIYIFSIPGVVNFIKSFKNFGIFLISLLILYPLGATFQCDDWHSRFTMVVIPYFILLSFYGAYFIFRKKKAI